jgi:hypothetical protein
MIAIVALEHAITRCILQGFQQRHHRKRFIVSFGNLKSWLLVLTGHMRHDLMNAFNPVSGRLHVRRR